MGEALEKFVAEAQGLYANFESTTLFSIGGWNISQYTLYMFIALALVLLAVLIGARKLEFIPHKKFTAILEYGYDFHLQQRWCRCYRRRLQEAHSLPGYVVLLHLVR